jgi:hypothetical protein
MNGCNIFISARLQNNVRRGEQEKGDSCICGESGWGHRRHSSHQQRRRAAKPRRGRVDIGGGEEAHRGAGHDEDGMMYCDRSSY